MPEDVGREMSSPEGSARSFSGEQGDSRGYHACASMLAKQRTKYLTCQSQILKCSCETPKH
jgi:hypothetical protein